MGWTQEGVLAWVMLEGEERLYLPPAGPGGRPWPMVARPWRMRLAQVRFRAREALARLGFPGVLPGLEATWVPAERRPALADLERRLDARLARVRREMEERYEVLREEAMRHIQRLVRRRIRMRPEGRSHAGEILQACLETAGRRFPPREFFQAYPRLVMVQAPVPVEWEGLIRAGGMPARAAEAFWEVFWALLWSGNGDGSSLHGRRVRQLEERLDRVPAGLLEGYPTLGRLAALMRQALRMPEGRQERLESLGRLLVEMVPPHQSF